MHCDSCGAGVSPGAAFCGGCGHPVGRVCAECGRSLRPGAAFCGGCGGAAGVPTQLTAAEAVDAEPTLVASVPASADAQWDRAQRPPVRAQRYVDDTVPPLPRDPWGDMGDDDGGGGAWRPSALVAAVAALAGAAVLVLCLASFIVVTATEHVPHFVARWLLLLPPPSSTGAYKTELVVLGAGGLAALIGGLSRWRGTRAVAVVLAVAFVAVVVGNAADLSSGDFVRLLLSQPEATATWLAGGLSLVAMSCVLFSTGDGRRVVPGLLVGAAVPGLVAALVVSTAPTFGYADNSYATSSAGDSAGSFDSSSAGTSSDTGISGVSSSDASANQPGECSSDWTSELDVVTSSMHATVCQAYDGSTILVANLSDGSTINLPAYPSSDGYGWNASDGTVSYQVDQSQISVYDNGTLTEQEYVGDSSTPDSAPAATTQSADGFLPAVSREQMRVDIQALLLRFHEDIVGGDFSDAWNLLSARRQRLELRERGYRQWVKNQKTLTPYLDPEGIHVGIDELDPSSGVARVTVTGMDWSAPNARCNQWSGVTWVKYEQGEWRYDPGYSTTRLRKLQWKHRFSELLGGSC